MRNEIAEMEKMYGINLEIQLKIDFIEGNYFYQKNKRRFFLHASSSRCVRLTRGFQALKAKVGAVAWGGGRGSKE